MNFATTQGVVNVPFMVPPGVPPRLFIIMAALPSLCSGRSFSYRPLVIRDSGPLPGSVPLVTKAPGATLTVAPSAPSGVNSP